MKKPVELFFFFQINNAAIFKTALRNNITSLVTSTTTVIGPATSQPLAFLNIAFSQRGLTTLGITDNLGDSFFSAGQFADASRLGDNEADWESAYTGNAIHGVFLIASDEQGNVNDLLMTITQMLGTSVTEVARLQGAARPGSEAGHERKFRILGLLHFYCASCGANAVAAP